MDTLNGSSEINYSVPLVVPSEKKERKNDSAKRPSHPSQTAASELASGPLASDVAQHVLVNTATGTTARIDSLLRPPAVVVPRDETETASHPQIAGRTQPHPFRCTYMQRQWMRAGQAVGILLPMSMAIALVTPIYLIAVGVIDTLALPALTAKYAIITCVGAWMTLTVATSVLMAPFLSASFGYRIRRTVLPIDVNPDSMHRLFIEMRCMIALLVGSQLLASFAGYFYLSNEAPLQMWTRWQPVLIGSAIFLSLGIMVLAVGHQAFLQTRGRKIRRWMHQCWRGVALRSFIPAWDNQRRPIFDSCRASRRLAAAYRSIKLGSASCFAAAGCLAAMSVGDSILGIAFVTASVIATLSVWPTSNRIVDWSKTIVDPITGESDED